MIHSRTEFYSSGVIYCVLSSWFCILWSRVVHLGIILSNLIAFCNFIISEPFYNAFSNGFCIKYCLCIRSCFFFHIIKSFPRIFKLSQCLSYQILVQSFILSSYSPIWIKFLAHYQMLSMDHVSIPCPLSQIFHLIILLFYSHIFNL